MVGFGNAATSGGVHWGGEDGPGYLAGAFIAGSGIGAATGALLDSRIRKPEQLYRE
jgi:hypothetical protein